MNRLLFLCALLGFLVAVNAADQPPKSTAELKLPRMHSEDESLKDLAATKVLLALFTGFPYPADCRFSKAGLFSSPPVESR